MILFGMDDNTLKALELMFVVILLIAMYVFAYFSSRD